MDIFKAIQEGNLAVVKSYLDNGGDINQINEDGKESTLLHYAVNSGSLEITQELLKRKPNVNKKTIKGNTALHLAVASGRHEITEAILSEGPVLNAQDKYGDTPLHLALGNSDLKMIRKLMTKGADINIPNKLGKTPLSVSEAKGIDAFLNNLSHEIQGKKVIRQVQQNITANNGYEAIEIVSQHHYNNKTQGKKPIEPNFPLPKMNESPDNSNRPDPPGIKYPSDEDNSLLNKLSNLATKPKNVYPNAAHLNKDKSQGTKKGPKL